MGSVVFLQYDLPYLEAIMKTARRGSRIAAFCLGAGMMMGFAAAALGALEGPALLEPEEATSMLAEADASPYEGADRLVLFDRTQVEVEESGLSHVYNHRFLKVLEFGGARALGAAFRLRSRLQPD